MGTELVARAATPRGELVLRRRGEQFELLLDDVLWLATYDDSAERALVGAAFSAVGAGRRVLVSGIGVGLMVRAVREFGPTAAITVVEPLSALVSWNQQFLRTALGGVRVVGSWADLAGERFDLVCLEDGAEPLDLVASLLAPGGVVAAWRPVRDGELLTRARRVFGRVEERPLPVLGGEPDYLYIMG